MNPAREAIKALFPNTYGMPLITFEAGEAVQLPAMEIVVDFPNESFTVADVVSVPELSVL